MEQSVSVGVPCKAVLRFVKAKLKTLMSGRANQSSVGRTGPANYRYCSQAVAHSLSWTSQGKKGAGFEHKLSWLNDEIPNKLFNRCILTVVFYYDFRISDQIRRLLGLRRVELNSSRTVFCQYCDQNVWNFSCMWCSIFWRTCSWNFIQFCCLQWKL